MFFCKICFDFQNRDLNTQNRDLSSKTTTEIHKPRLKTPKPRLKTPKPRLKTPKPRLMDFPQILQNNFPEKSLKIFFSWKHASSKIHHKSLAL